MGLVQEKTGLVGLVQERMGLVQESGGLLGLVKERTWFLQEDMGLVQERVEFEEEKDPV